MSFSSQFAALGLVTDEHAQRIEREKEEEARKRMERKKLILAEQKFEENLSSLRTATSPNRFRRYAIEVLKSEPGRMSEVLASAEHLGSVESVFQENPLVMRGDFKFKNRNRSARRSVC